MSYFAELTGALHALDLAPLLPFVRGCTGVLWLCGNGGSFATAQHWACDLTKHAGVCAQALGSNGALLTALANDHGYDRIFADELGQRRDDGDRLICLSCSGRSENIVQAIGQARRLGMALLLITGQDAPTYAETPAIRIPSNDYGVIEDCFSAIGHWLTKELTA